VPSILIWWVPVSVTSSPRARGLHVVVVHVGDLQVPGDAHRTGVFDEGRGEARLHVSVPGVEVEDGRVVDALQPHRALRDVADVVAVAHDEHDRALRLGRALRGVRVDDSLEDRLVVLERGRAADRDLMGAGTADAESQSVGEIAGGLAERDRLVPSIGRRRERDQRRLQRRRRSRGRGPAGR
jgi:hypothetical protein